MQGPTQRWDQPPDPRESTVSIPRIDPSSPAGQVSESATTAAYDGGIGIELPGFGDPYALPVRAAGSLPAGSLPAGAGGSGGSSPRPVAEPGPAPTAELTGPPEPPATPAPAAASLSEPEEPSAPATPEPPEAEDLPAPDDLLAPEDLLAPDDLLAREDLLAPEDLLVSEGLPEAEDLPAPETPGQSAAVNPGVTGQPPRRAVRRAEIVATGKPRPGSIADLRGRLERLPDGHPSSPYDDGGWLKPSPTRLRQLELGLPARSLGAPPGYAERFGIDPDDDWLNDGLPGAAAADARHQPATRADEQVVAAESAQVPMAQPAKPPSRATRPAASNGHRDPDDGDGRPQPQHPYGPAAQHDQGSNGSGPGDLALTSWPGPARDTPADRAAGPAGPAGSAYHRNGHHAAAKPPDASRAEPGDAEIERRRPGPGRDDLSRLGNGTAATRPRMAPELRDLVDRVLAACRAAEGRNAHGGYGTSGLTPALRRIAAALPDGGLAPGGEADTLKPADRFAARLARLIDRQPGRPPAELAATISDGIRYAFTFPAGGYTEGTLLVHRKLKAQGFDLEARRNQWDSREYKGIFTRWRDPAHGLAFEVQFHTSESWAVVKQTHEDYLRITDPVTPAAERARLRARQAAAAATVSAPPGCLNIADVRLGPR